MTYRKDMSDKNDYSNMSKTDLANGYLFDELVENDTQIKSTIDEALKESDINDTIMANLILLKYQIFKRQIDEVIKQTEYLNELFEKNKSESNLKGLKMAFNAIIFQIEIMK
jgi:transposase